MSILAVRGLTRSYGDVVAVGGVNLDVAAGSRAAIVGPSGSGKTTLLRLIAGFEAPDAGSIALEGRTLAGDGELVPPHHRNIGYVAQEGALFPHLSIAENIGFGLVRADKPQRVGELMELVGLPHGMANRRPHELSGGQQQRVALARALARRPRLMLLDEPFSALDAALRESVRDMVGKVLAAAGTTAILVTHDQAEALSFADHLAVMRDGRIVQAGAPRELYLHPRDALTAQFLGEAIVLDGRTRASVAETALGPIALAADLGEGPVTVMIRPEQVQVLPAKPDRANAQATGCTFRGPRCRVMVEAHGLAFAIEVPSSEAPSVGDALRLTVCGIGHVLEPS